MGPAANGRSMRATRVAVCGGGVAALEALIALRELLDIRPHITLVAPNRRFVYQPLAVAEPFGLERSRRLEMTAIAEDLGVELRACSLLRVDGAHRQLELSDGSQLRYDAAIIAVGARRRRWLDGAIAFGGADDAPSITELLGRLERGSVSRVAFAAAPAPSWTLPVYELALLTATRLAERGVMDARLTLLTPEEQPLEVFGRGAGRMMRDTLADRGIALKTGVRVERFADGRVSLTDGRTLEAEEVVAFARMAGPRIPGVPADAEGFVRVDRNCRVVGERSLYAAGDGTDFAVKQGGVAAQQADAAAEAVAAELGAPVESQPFEPMLRAMLLTGLAPMYLRTAPNGDEAPTVAPNTLWWPPGKVAARYLGPYLAGIDAPGQHEALQERSPSAHDAATVSKAQAEARDLALLFAESDARGGDFRSALNWLDVVESLDGVLPEGYLERRDSWRLRVA